MLSQCLAWAGWGISECNTPRRWASRLSASHAARTKSRSPGSWVHQSTSTVSRKIPPWSCASVVIATVTAGAAMSAVVGGLAVNGTLLVIGAPESLQLLPVALIGGQLSVKGWYSGMSIDSEDTLAFSARTGVQSMNETFPFERVNEAYERMMSGKARFRVVLTMK